MSELHDTLNDIVEDRYSATSDTVLNTRDGSTFQAEIEGNLDPILVQSELGEDIREVVILHVFDNAQSKNIKSQDIVRFTLYGMTVMHQIVKRRNNSAGPCDDFWARKVLNKDS